MKHEWGKVDFASIVTALVVVLAFTAMRKKYRTTHGVIVLAGAGLSLCPLLLLLIDPFAENLGFMHGSLAAALGVQNESLLELVITEGRTSLWLASLIASMYLIRDLL